MKCYNLTDVETPELKKRGLVNRVLAVRSVLIPPGGCADVPEDATSRRDADNYVKVGALAIDDLPIAYSVTKARMKPVEVFSRKADKKKRRG
ncbi:MAG: hypothetical protein EBU88_07400 [Acidobacteria bacterium]|nr:hypothetical protein [Acidobacteriota bacterium]